MNILYLASEAYPFAKVGGLADVAGALPKEMEKLGHKTILFLPKYGTIDEKIVGTGRALSLQKTKIKYDIKIAGKKYVCALWQSALPKSRVKIYFIENEKLFNKGGVYEGKNLLLKFSLFCRAALEGTRRIGFKPDIINCNDWHTAPVPAVLKTILKDDAFFKNTKTVISIHNIGYQGEFPVSEFKNTGLDASFINIFEFHGRVNCLKAGVICADAINTVSPTYAQEIKTPQYGHGLEILLKDKPVHGILNGADYGHWNPESDTYIAENYNKKHPGYKTFCKATLQKLCGLEVKSAFLLGMVTRLVDQKGFDILAKVIDEILNLDLQFIILGTGEKKYEKMFTALQKKYPKKISVNLRFDNPLAHKIEAGADAFLMPSKYEPCGLNQIYSLKYGTPPIVRKTGGLADTVIDFDEKTKCGTGFVFTYYSSDELLKAVKRAYRIYEDGKKWRKLVLNAMRADFSWKASAKEYVKLYKLAIKQPAV